MNSKSLKRSVLRRQAGSVMLLSLMIMGVTTLGVAAWVTLINGRTAYSEASEDGMRRRVAIRNSREIAEEYLYRYAAAGGSGVAASYPVDPVNSPATPYDPSEPDIVEQVEVAAWSGAPFDSISEPGRMNRLSPADDTAYFQKFTIALGRGDHQVLRDFELRSRAPMFGGDLVTLHYPTIDPTSNLRVRGNVEVRGRTVIWRPDIIDLYSTNRYSSDEYALVDDAYGEYDIYNPSGDQIRPSNFPFPPMTAGAVSASNLGYNGQISTVENTYNTFNSMHAAPGSAPVTANGLVSSSQQGVVSNGAGTVTIDLNEPSLKKVYIHNDTSAIRLNGQITQTEFDDADSYSPLQIIIVQDASSQRNLSMIECYQRNNRRLVVGVKKSKNASDPTSYLRVSFRWMNSNSTPFPTWRLVAISENSEIRFQHNTSNSQVTVYGGVRTDRGFYSHDSSSRKFILERETDPLGLESLLLVDRNIWIESYPN